MNDQGPKKDILVAALVGAAPTTGMTTPGTGAPPPVPKTDETAAIRSDIERTRGQMSATVEKIEERLSPARIEEQVAELKESVLGNYHEAKDHLKQDISRELREAKDKVKEEILDVKDKVQDGIEHARTAVHDATVGKVEHMMHDAREMVHDAGETVTHAGSSVLGAIKANPIPAALAAVGIGWLIMSSRRSSATVTPRRLYLGEYDDEVRYGYGRNGYGRYDRGEPLRAPRGALREGQRAVGNAIHQAEEGVMHAGQRVQRGAQRLAGQASGLAHDIEGRVETVAHDVGERVHHLTEEVGHYAHDAGVRGGRMVRQGVRQVRRAEQTFEGKIRENPLAFGAVALAVGAAIGLALPSTHPEDEWMGAMKDRFIDRAEGFAGEALHRVEETVTHQLGNGEDEQRDQQDSSSMEPKNGLSNGLSGKSAKSGTKSSSV